MKKQEFAYILTLASPDGFLPLFIYKRKEKADKRLKEALKIADKHKKLLNFSYFVREMVME